LADVIWCKVCDTVNYLDPYTFWNWQGNVKCAECDTVYAIHMISGFMYKGPDKTDSKDFMMPLYADKPNEGYVSYTAGTEGKTRVYECLPRGVYLGRADMVKFSIRGHLVRGWSPQPPSTGVAGSSGYFWDVERLSPEVWQEYQEKKKKGEVKDW
jgi:hypothetical protein